MPEIKNITIKGFKSIASIQKLPLRAINLVIGANGSGKSNFLGAFSALRAVGKGRMELWVKTEGGANSLLHFGRKVTSSIFLEIWIENNIGYWLRLVPDSRDQFVVADEVLELEELPMVTSRRVPRHISISTYEAGLSAQDADDATEAGLLAKILRKFNVYH